MRHFSEFLGFDPGLYLRALVNPYVALGIGMLALSLLTRMALLSVADLSVVLPLTAFGYIVTAVLGKLILSEQISLGHWLGTLLIFFGIVLVTSTSIKANHELASQQ